MAKYSVHLFLKLHSLKSNGPRPYVDELEVTSARKIFSAKIIAMQDK